MPEGIQGRLADLYDVFVDWKGRLQREMPGLTARLRETGALKVLDVGCGTGRHVGALLEEGLDAHGADVSADMLDKAAAFTNAPERFVTWRAGTPVAEALAAKAPFDAIVCMGNVWPQIVQDPDVTAAARSFHDLLGPGGLLLMGLKAFEARRESENPYLPLLRREHEGRPLYFIRFVDFTPPRPYCEMHMAVVGGDNECLLHQSHIVRSWDPGSLVQTFQDAGFAEVRVSGSLADPEAPPATEDVFVSARR